MDVHRIYINGWNLKNKIDNFKSKKLFIVSNPLKVFKTDCHMQYGIKQILYVYIIIIINF